jgi:hypothetical protein
MLVARTTGEPVDLRRGRDLERVHARCEHHW